jgi:hypothetical protein
MTRTRQAGSGRPILIIADARTGSSWCAQILDSHPAVRFYGEVFIHNIRPHELGLPHAPANPRGFSQLPAPPLIFAQYAHQHRGAFKVWRYLYSLLNQPTLPPVLGFKFMYSQWIVHPSVLLWASAHRARVIHLVRTNQLQRVMSSHVFKATQVPHATERVQIPPFRVDPSAVISAVRGAERRVTKARAVLRTVPVRTLEVSYEALRREPDRVSRRLFHALGLEPVEYQPRGKTRQVVDRPYDQIVSNYAELRNELDRHGIRYEL